MCSCSLSLAGVLDHFLLLSRDPYTVLVRHMLAHSCSWVRARAEPGYKDALGVDKAQVVKVLVTLDELYALHRTAGIPIDTEAEFLSYFILIKVLPYPPPAFSCLLSVPENWLQADSHGGVSVHVRCFSSLQSTRSVDRAVRPRGDRGVH